MISGKFWQAIENDWYNCTGMALLQVLCSALNTRILEWQTIRICMKLSKILEGDTWGAAEVTLFSLEKRRGRCTSSSQGTDPDTFSLGTEWSCVRWKSGWVLRKDSSSIGWFQIEKFPREVVTASNPLEFSKHLDNTPRHMV